jgi:lipoprotein-anchoring transpeptidase ErfK/SrfK
MIRPKLAAGQLDEALKDLTPWHDHSSLTPSEREWLRGLLGELAGTVIYSRQHTLSEPYRVRAGERLEEIAERYKVSAELLAKINGLDPTRTIELRPGDELKIVPGPFSAIVDLTGQRLILELDGRYAGSFPLAQIGAAAGEKTPAVGGPMELSVTQKTVTPIYNGPRGEVESDDPANPLGQHLLGLGSELALHGTNPKASPDTPQPSGGIRMNAADIAEVYDILTVGSRVTLRR